MRKFDKIILGAGFYGLYAALFCGKRGETVLILECENAAFSRASYVNQARVHMGYHYPRSFSTAAKSRNFFDRFNRDFHFCINNKFEKIYATSQNLSWTNAEQFQQFCENSQIRCTRISPTTYFKKNLCDGAFITTEYTYDAQILKNWLLKEIAKLPNIIIFYNSRIKFATVENSHYMITKTCKNGENTEKYATKFLLNTTYAAVNQIHNLLGFEPINIKYELCEIVLVRAEKPLQNVGITVMDGAFFSLMPFGKTGLHSLTSVTFTPHNSSFSTLPTFACQNENAACSPQNLENCNNCPAKPPSAWEYMANLARKYLRNEFAFEYVNSLYSMKPILKSSEIDDSRPTFIRKYSDKPKFISVLSGKINTVYELEEVLL
ncbi:MAG: FAD-binding oxidoreductase [Firmicutes bacterium]|nr:FAD-binding oxidoreductase [Bacillota bacterium]